MPHFRPFANINQSLDVLSSEASLIAEPSTPLIGRQKELEEGLSHLGAAFTGSGLVLMVSGEPGIGKSYFVQELEKAAKNIGFVCFDSLCEEGSERKDQPFDKILFELTKSKGLVTPSQAAIAPITLLNAVRTEAEKAPIFLKLEDMHWCYKEGASLLHYLARNIRDLRAIIVSTYQTTEMITADGPVPMLETLHLMGREDLYKEIELKSMPLEKVADIIRQYLGGSIDEDLIEQIWAYSNGNPYVATELVRMLVQSKKIMFVGDRWVKTEDTTIEVPDPLHAAAEQKLKYLSHEDRRLLECASAIGETFDPIIVVDILDQDRLESLERMDDLVRKNHLLIDQGAQYQFINKATHLAVYYDIPTSRRKELHRLIAKRLEKSKDSNRADIALQLFLSDQKEPCVCYALLAGIDCMEREAWTQAVECFQRAVETSENDLPQVREMAERELKKALDHVEAESGRAKKSFKE
jgi:predicted ATPase